MIYQYRFIIAVGAFIIIALSDSWFYLYPLYLNYLEKKNVLSDISSHYQETKNKIVTNTLFTSQSTEQMMPYKSTEWLRELTKCMTSLSLSIQKIERQSTDVSSAITIWHVMLRGNPDAIADFFYLFYNYFPWLSFTEPIFTLKDNAIDVSFKLLALINKPANFNHQKPLQKQHIVRLPFCQTNRHATMHRSKKTPFNINGIIQSSNTKTILKRVDHDQISLSINKNISN